MQSGVSEERARQAREQSAEWPEPRDAGRSRLEERRADATWERTNTMEMQGWGASADEALVERGTREREGEFVGEARDRRAGPTVFGYKLVDRRRVVEELRTKEHQYSRSRVGARERAHAMQP